MSSTIIPGGRALIAMAQTPSTGVVDINISTPQQHPTRTRLDDFGAAHLLFCRALQPIPHVGAWRRRSYIVRHLMATMPRDEPSSSSHKMTMSPRFIIGTIVKISVHHIFFCPPQQKFRVASHQTVTISNNKISFQSQTKLINKQQRRKRKSEK